MAEFDVTPQERAGRRPPNRWWGVLVLVVVLAGAAVAGVWFIAPGGPDAEPVADETPPPTTAVVAPTAAPPTSERPVSKPTARPTATKRRATTKPVPVPATTTKTRTTKPPTVFAITSPHTVDRCSTVAGTGEKPAGKVVVLFIQEIHDDKYYYERPVRFTKHRWSARQVYIGDPGDGGASFRIHAVRVRPVVAAELATHDGAPYFVKALPGTTLDTSVVRRAKRAANC